MADVAFPPLQGLQTKRSLLERREASQVASERIQAEHAARIEALRHQQTEQRRIQSERQRKERDEKQRQWEQKQRERETKVALAQAQRQADGVMRGRYMGYVEKNGSALLARANMLTLMEEPNSINELDYSNGKALIDKRYNLNSRWTLFYIKCRHSVHPQVGSQQEAQCLEAHRLGKMVETLILERGCPYCAKTMRQSPTRYLLEALPGHEYQDGTSLQSRAEILGRLDQGTTKQSAQYMFAYAAYYQFLYVERLFISYEHFCALIEHRMTIDEVMAEINATLSKYTKRVAARTEYFWPRA